MTAPALPRLSKRMGELGLCSRREADKWIENGWVKVDGKVVDTLGVRVSPQAHIEIDPAARDHQSTQVTILLHKPVGYVSGQAEDGYEPAVVLITPANRWSSDPSPLQFAVTICGDWRQRADWISTRPGCWCSRRTGASPSN